MTAHPEISQKERKNIIKKFDEDNRIFCSIGLHEISKKSDIEFHHINPYLPESKLESGNVGIVCKTHHRELGQLSISEFSALKDLEKFFGQTSQPRLDDLIFYRLKTGVNAMSHKIYMEKNTICISYLNGDNQKIELPFFICPSTHLKFFYMLLPAEYINNDIELQPRPLDFKRLWELYRHLTVSSQLTPSVCRLVKDKIYLFDGQHKAAAQIWAGRGQIECKVYIDPPVRILKETNLIAHDKLRQMPFFTSVLLRKWASIFSEEWQDYMDGQGEKSEAGFVLFLISRGRRKNEALNMIESNIYESILEDDKNKIKPYLEFYQDDFKKPLTVNRLIQSFLKKFISGPPLSISLEESDRLREMERVNCIKLLNLITRYSITDLWDPLKNDKNHKASERIYLNGSFKAVCSIIRDTVATILELYDETERKEFFLREVSLADWELIEKSIEAIFSNRVWYDESEENYNNLRISNEGTVRKYLSRRGLSVNWILNYSTDSGNNFID